jgi:hypothetical protein
MSRGVLGPGGPNALASSFVKGHQAAFVVTYFYDEPLVEREQGTGVTVVSIAWSTGDFVFVVQVEVPDVAPIGGIPAMQVAIGAEGVEQVCLRVIFRG